MKKAALSWVTSGYMFQSPILPKQSKRREMQAARAARARRQLSSYDVFQIDAEEKASAKPGLFGRIHILLKRFFRSFAIPGQRDVDRMFRREQREANADALLTPQSQSERARRERIERYKCSGL